MKNDNKFYHFQKELYDHDAEGYHSEIQKYSSSEIANICDEMKIEIPEDYSVFLQEIGTGNFFGGDLVFFPLLTEDGDSVISFTLKLETFNINDKIVIGYDGTTEGAYCLSMDKNDSAVYWLFWDTGVFSVVSDNFSDWINSLPKTLFSKKIYSGFKKIKNIDKIYDIIKQRSTIKIRLVSYNKNLTRPPNKKEDALPRYHELVLEILKTKDVSIKNFTFSGYRTNSPVGKNNLAYVTIPMDSIPLNKAKIVKVYLFDPFNVPFDDIIINVNPNIDLSSSSRSHYKEISDYL